MVSDFEALYKKYFSHVFKYILAISRNEDIAEEITQQTFLKAMTSIDKFRGDCNIRVWLCQIAKNQYLMLQRERKHFDNESEIEETTEFEEHFFDREDSKNLHRLLHKMPEPYKEVFTLRTFGELSYAQIGELFQKSESWARVTYFRAKEKLKEDFYGTRYNS